MKRLTRTLPLILAAALQLLPLLRNIVTSPAASSSFAIILRWGIGAGAALSTVDAVSGASAAFISATNFTGTANQFFSNSIVVSLVGTGNPAATSDGFTLTNLLNTADHTTNFISNGKSTTNAMPPGLTFTCISINNADYIYGSITGKVATAGTYYIHVVCTSPGNASIATNVFFTISGSLAAPPIITNSPVSLTNNVGSNVTFTVTAGTAPLSYQWYFNTNTSLFNATNATLTLTNIQLTNDGYYRCIITNTAGLTNTIDARLTVWQPPVITNPPIGITNIAGGSATFSVVAGGVPAVAYQWQLASANLIGSNNAALPLTNLRASQAGNYTVIITNSAGSVTSSIASLVVTNPLPTAFTPTSPVKSSSQFQFTFTPVAGLTNTVLTNGVMVGGTWNVFTNIPPQATAALITIIDSPGAPSRFYRVQVVP